MSDDALRRTAAAQVPAAIPVVREAAAAIAADDPWKACRAISEFVLAEPCDRELVAGRVNAYLSVGLTLAGLQVKRLAGGEAAILVPQAEAGPAERAVVLAITEMANGDPTAAQDALLAHRRGGGHFAEITTALTAILADLCSLEPRQVAADG